MSIFKYFHFTVINFSPLKGENVPNSFIQTKSTSGKKYYSKRKNSPIISSLIFHFKLNYFINLPDFNTYKDVHSTGFNLNITSTVSMVIPSMPDDLFAFLHNYSLPYVPGRQVHDVCHSRFGSNILFLEILELFKNWYEQNI